MASLWAIIYCPQSFTLHLWAYLSLMFSCLYLLVMMSISYLDLFLLTVVLFLLAGHIFPLYMSHVFFYFLKKITLVLVHTMLLKVEIFLALKSDDFCYRRQVSCQQINLTLLQLIFKLCQWEYTGSLVAQLRKDQPAMEGTGVWSLGWEDPLEKGSSILFCLENPHGQRNLVGYSPWGGQESDMTEQLSIAQ